MVLGIGLALSLGTVPAWADGEYFQLDVSRDATDSSLSITRGRLSYGATYADYDGGSSASLSVLWSIPVQDVGTFKIGPSVAQIFDDNGPDRTRGGAKVVFERWMPTDFGHLFLLGEYSTIDNTYFGLVQTGFGNSGFATELSVGGSDSYDEVTATVTKRIGEGPWVLRAGYKFRAEAVFLGFAINTF